MKRFPLLRKIVGIILILIGLFALFTPLTPGSWLAILGLELVGIRLAFVEKIKLHLKKRTPFWKSEVKPEIITPEKKD
jgi:protein-S-isoprenylcysteine O-methyltransferase Ste14